MLSDVGGSRSELAAAEAEKNVDSQGPEKQEEKRCSLCQCELNSAVQAKAHFTGIRHLKELQKHGHPMSEVDRDKLSRHQKKMQQKEMGAMWLYGAPMMRSMPVPHPQLLPYNKPTPAEPGICQSCGVAFNSLTQASEHYSGQKHRMQLLRLNRAPQSLDCDFSDEQGLDSLLLSFDNSGQHADGPQVAAPQTTCVPSSARTAGVTTATERRRNVGEKKTTQKKRVNYAKTVHCDICNLDLNSASQAVLHYRGLAHNSQLIWSARQAAIMPIVQHEQQMMAREKTRCSLCNVTLNSPAQLEDHLQGRLHSRRQQTIECERSRFRGSSNTAATSNVAEIRTS